MSPRNDDRLWLTPEEVAARRAEFERRHREARRRRPQPVPVLGDLHDGHDWLWLYCETTGCRHFTAVPLVPLLIRWGASASSGLLRTRFRCSRCGLMNTSIRSPSPARAAEAIDHRKQWTGKQEWHPDLGAFSVADMCNLYSNTRSREAVRAWFRVSDNRAYAFEPMPAIFPKTVAPIVRLATDGEREMVPASWGFPLLQKGYAPRPVTNVRDDKVLTSPFWRPSFEARRCLVPASSYCEPDDQKPAGWHWFSLLPGPSDAHAFGASGPSAGAERAPEARPEERPLFAFPGIWKRYNGPMKKDGPTVEIDVYAFMTTTPNALTATIMHDRMPVLLSEEADFETWLSAPPEEAYRLVRTYDADRMRIVQSGKEKRDLLGADA